MKKIITLLFLLLCTKTSLAQNLCDASCNLTITFPGSGSISAFEPLTITFGSGGVLELGATGTVNSAVPPASIDYSMGGILTLAAGESITFDINGALDLGAGGNINYTDMGIATSGDFVVETVGGTGAITIADMSLTATSIVIASDLTIENNLTLSGNTTISGTGSIVNTGVLDIGLDTTIIETNIDMSNGTIGLSPGTLEIATSGSLMLSGGQIIVDDSLTTFQVDLVNNINITGGTITLLKEITIDGVFYQSDDGVLFKDPDGATGSLEFKDGAFVFIPDIDEQVAGDGGASSLLFLLGLPMIVLVLRRRQTRIFSMR